MKRRQRIKKKRLARRRPVNVLASVLTTVSLYCGIGGIFASISGKYTVAAKYVLAAIVFDVLDGAVAKLTRSVSDFGKELDSLADLVSFGVAPAVLIYTAYLHQERLSGPFIYKTGSVLAVIYVICGALRLARFNVYQSEQREYFTGLPIPAAAVTIASFVLFTQTLGLDVAFYVLGPLTLLLAGLMVSTVRYPKDKLKYFILAPRNAFRLLVLCVAAIAAFHYASEQLSPVVALFPLTATYLLFGLADTAFTVVRRRQVRRRANEERVQETSPDPASRKTEDLL